MTKRPKVVELDISKPPAGMTFEEETVWLQENWFFCCEGADEDPPTHRQDCPRGR